jgi:DNA-binding MarR family transcriptional regulator
MVNALSRYAPGMSDQPAAPGPGGPGGRPADSATALYGLLATLLRRASRDLSLTSLATLATLDRTGPRRITDLALIEGVTQPSMTVLVTALERGGLVARQSDPADGRVTLVALTDQGRLYLGRRRSAGADALAQIIDKLPPAEAAALAAAIPALRHLRDLDDEQRDPDGRPHGEQRAPG